jgi:hypothetical protein
MPHDLHADNQQIPYIAFHTKTGPAILLWSPDVLQESSLNQHITAKGAPYQILNNLLAKVMINSVKLLFCE